MMIAGLLIWGGSLWAVAQTRMTIAQLFERIEENSKSLRTSKSGVEAASIGIESAKSKKLPDLDASLSFSYIGNALMTDRDFSNAQGLKSPHFGNNFAFQAQQVVYAGGAINAGIRLAELGKQQAEVGVKLTRQQARFIALGQYLDLYKIDNRIKVYEKHRAHPPAYRRHQGETNPGNGAQERHPPIRTADGEPETGTHFTTQQPQYPEPPAPEYARHELGR